MLRTTLVIIALTLALSNNVFSQDAGGRSSSSNRAILTSVPFLTIAPDSRGAAMGDAGVASSADVSSQHWNAAKYVFAKEQLGGAISYTPWLKSLGVTDLNLLYLTGYKKFDARQALSASIRYFDLGEIKELNEFGDATGNRIKPNEWTMDVGYSRLFSDNLSAAMVFRFIYSDIANGASNLSAGAENQPGTSYAADLSTYYQKSVRLGDYDGEMAYGLNISNIGAKMNYSDNNESQFIPTNLRLGGRVTMELDAYNKVSGMLDINKLLVPRQTITDSTIYGPIEGIYTSFYDAEDGGKEELSEIMYSFGLEYLYMDQFAIRAGYFHEHEDKGNRKYLTFGIGLVYTAFSIDFSYLVPAGQGKSNPLANTMRFTLGYRFE